MRMETVLVPHGQWVAIGNGLEVVGFHVDTSRPVRMHVSESRDMPPVDAPYLPIQTYMPNVSFAEAQFALGPVDNVFLMADGTDAKVTVLVAEHGRTIGAAQLIEQGKRDGRAYVVTTGNATIANGQRLKFEITNPIGSGARFWVYQQTFTNDRQGNDEMLVRGGRPSDTPLITDGIPLTPIRLNNDPTSPSSTRAQCFMLADGSPPVTNLAVGENLPLNGVRVVNEVLFVMYPGRSFVYEVEGASGALVDPARASIAVQYFEEDWFA